MKGINDDIFEQIKDFNHRQLTEEQSSLVNKLILDEDLKERYKSNGLCKECKQPNTGYGPWCHLCNAKHFQQNFNNWTSGNPSIDQFIRFIQLSATTSSNSLEWIEYDRFENVEYLAKGGFGITYKAIYKDGFIVSWDSENNQWKRVERVVKVVLKSLHDSQNVTNEFLNEIKLHVLASLPGFVIPCYGITKDPKTNDFMMVMEYAENGSLRHHLNDNFNSMGWKTKLDILYSIATGLNCIHNNGLIHRDFHSGNILSHSDYETLITDLGLCQPANVKSSNKEIYGVLPYVAPEVLRGKEYTQESDIYGFGIIAHEVCTGLPPYSDIAHDSSLAIRICKGLRPKSNYKIPQLILNIINQCWDVDPSKRLKTHELFNLLCNLYWEVRKEDSLINKQIKEVDEINEKLFSYANTTLSYTTSPQAVYTSRLLDFKNLPEPSKSMNLDSIDLTDLTDLTELW